MPGASGKTGERRVLSMELDETDLELYGSALLGPAAAGATRPPASGRPLRDGTALPGTAPDQGATPSKRARLAATAAQEEEAFAAATHSGMAPASTPVFALLARLTTGTLEVCGMSAQRQGGLALFGLLAVPLRIAPGLPPGAGPA